MSEDRTFVIVGASLAGAKAAETLREDGFEGRVVLLGEEPARPYERPPLSKDYLQGKSGLETIFVHEEQFYAQHNIELRTSTVARAIDLANRDILLATDERIRFDSLLLATGSTPRRIQLPGADLDGVHYLRDLADADHLRSVITETSRVAVIGAGWIGCEVAASARSLGAHVAIIEVGDLPLERVLGPELGRFYRDVHADHGVELHLGVGIESLRGDEHIEEIRLTNGSAIACDVVVVGVGATPRVELAETAGIEIDNGVVTDEFLASSVPGIFAASDIANAWHPTFGRHIRLEHWSAALNQGPVAAKNMLATPTPYDRVPYFFSDQYDIGMEYAGFATDWDEVIFRGDPASREFIAFWLKDGLLAAGMNINIWDVSETIAGLVAARQPVDRAALIDPAVDLTSLIS